MVFAAMVAVSVVLGCYLMLRQQRGEKKGDLPLKTQQENEALAKSKAGDLEMATKDEEAIRSKPCSVDPSKAVRLNNQVIAVPQQEYDGKVGAHMNMILPDPSKFNPVKMKK